VGVPPNKNLGITGTKNGGCDRDRTCDPYHVKEARRPEIADYIGNSGMKNGAEGRDVPSMFTFSGSMNLRALPRRFPADTAVETGRGRA
jgi:hypothetical protein